MTNFRSGCPIASALDILGDKWSLLIVRSLALGASSYTALLAQPESIATNILVERLRRLDQAGIVKLARPRSGRTAGIYTLTRRGAALIPVVQALAKWGEANISDRWKPPARFYALKPDDLLGNDGAP